jgi:5-methyltetrahydrofolate--homocysteine methyltransferase
LSRLLSLFGTGLVIADGAWGTEFQKRGLALGQPADLWNLTRPADVESVAQAYVDAGSQVILTNTFRSNPVALAAIGEADRAAEINRKGAELSRKAAGSDVRVFGSMGPIGKVLATREIDEQKVVDAFKVQAEALASGGADALLLETFSDIEEARLAVCAIKPIGLPILVSFAFISGKNVDQTMTGATPEAVGRAVAAAGADAVGANCGDGPECFPAICRRLKESSGLPVWIKPNAGIPVLSAGQAVYTMAPNMFAGHLASLIEAGASFVGGCCGTSPEFVRALVMAARSGASI